MLNRTLDLNIDEPVRGKSRKSKFEQAIQRSRQAAHAGSRARSIPTQPLKDELVEGRERGPKRKSQETSTQFERTDPTTGEMQMGFQGVT